MKLPLRIHRAGSSFSIKDAHDTTICYVYFDKGNASERAIRRLMSEEEAEPIAKQIARLLTDAETRKEADDPTNGAAGKFNREANRRAQEPFEARDGGQTIRERDVAPDSAFVHRGS